MTDLLGIELYVIIVPVAFLFLFALLFNGIHENAILKRRFQFFQIVFDSQGMLQSHTCCQFLFACLFCIGVNLTFLVKERSQG
jgi:hypothetical protein